MNTFLVFRRAIALAICPELATETLEPSEMEANHLRAIAGMSTLAREASMKTEHLLELASLYARHAGRSESTVSNWIVGHARLFSRLRAGHGTTVKTFYRTLDWFSRNWPDDLDWPDGIARPDGSEHAA